MSILPLTSDHLSGTTTLMCGHPRQVSLYNQTIWNSYLVKHIQHTRRIIKKTLWPNTYIRHHPTKLLCTFSVNTAGTVAAASLFLRPGSTCSPECGPILVADTPVIRKEMNKSNPSLPQQNSTVYGGYMTACEVTII